MMTPNGQAPARRSAHRSSSRVRFAASRPASASSVDPGELEIGVAEEEPPARRALARVRVAGAFTDAEAQQRLGLRRALVAQDEDVIQLHWTRQPCGHCGILPTMIRPGSLLAAVTLASTLIAPALGQGQAADDDRALDRREGRALPHGRRLRRTRGDRLSRTRGAGDGDRPRRDRPRLGREGERDRRRSEDRERRVGGPRAAQYCTARVRRRPRTGRTTTST